MQHEEQSARDEDEEPTGSQARTIRIKGEDEMSAGKGHPIEFGEAQFEYDPASRRTPEEGGEPQ